MSLQEECRLSGAEREMCALGRSTGPNSPGILWREARVRVTQSSANRKEGTAKALIYFYSQSNEDRGSEIGGLSKSLNACRISSRERSRKQPYFKKKRLVRQASSSHFTTSVFGISLHFHEELFTGFSSSLTPNVGVRGWVGGVGREGAWRNQGVSQRNEQHSSCMSEACSLVL